MREIAKRTAPSIIEFDGKERISSSKWNDAVGCEYILREGANKWISLNELCRLAYGSVNKANQQRIRSYAWRLRRWLIINQNLLLITDGRPIHSMKIYVRASAEEQQMAAPMLRQMVRRKDFSTDICDRAMNIYRGIEYVGSAAEVQSSPSAPSA
jgi:hypothetical protein